jgi:ribosome-associated protein
MPKKNSNTTSIITSEDYVQWVVKGMQEKKAQEISILDLRGVSNAFTDFFVICSGTSDTQIDAISDSIEEEVWKGLHVHPHVVEGRANKEWILMDFYDVVVHVFQKDKRAFFKLEDLWGDAKFTNIPD